MNSARGAGQEEKRKKKKADADMNVERAIQTEL